MDLTHSWIARICGVASGFAALFAYFTADFELRWQPSRRHRVPSSSPRSGVVRRSAQLTHYPSARALDRPTGAA